MLNDLLLKVLNSQDICQSSGAYLCQALVCMWTVSSTFLLLIRLDSSFFDSSSCLSDQPSLRLSSCLTWFFLDPTSFDLSFIRCKALPGFPIGFNSHCLLEKQECLASSCSQESLTKMQSLSLAFQSALNLTLFASSMTQTRQSVLTVAMTPKKNSLSGSLLEF